MGSTLSSIEVVLEEFSVLFLYSCNKYNNNNNNNSYKNSWFLEKSPRVFKGRHICS